MTDVADQAPLRTEADLPRMDVDSPQFRDNPHAALRTVRAQGRFVASRRGVEVLSHADVLKLLIDERLHSQDADAYRRYGAQEMLVAFAREGLLSAMQGDKHDRIRRVFLAAFRARQIEAQRGLMRATAQELIDGLPDAGHGDFVSLFSNPFPMQVLCQIIGIPVADIGEFSAAATQLHLLAQTPLAPGFPAVERALQQLWDYCLALVKARRAHPADDAISALIQVQETEGRVTDEEVIWNIANLIFAGQDTTRYQLASALHVVTAIPGLWRQMQENPGLVPSVAEETLRFAPVVNFVVRIPREDVDYEGVRLARGRRVILNFQAASRDPERFTDPDVFAPRQPGRHAHSFDVPFGLGMHYCLGAALARAEIQESLAVLAERLCDVEVDAAPEMTEPAAMLHGPERMTFRYTKRGSTTYSPAKASTQSPA
jgi:cytochrome P450